MKEKIKARLNQAMTDLCAVWLAIRRRETPWYAKAAGVVALVYALSPVDLIPDFIPVLGYLDDALILPLLVTLAVRWIPKNVMEECRISSRGMWKDGKPEKWYYAIPVVLLWLLLLFLIIKWIFF